MSLIDKERLREGEEISSGDEIERKEINRQAKEFMNKGFHPGDAWAAAIENADRRRELDFS